MSRKTVPSQISKHLEGSKEEKEEQFYSSNSRHVRRALEAYLTELKEARVADMLSRKHYTAGSWPEQQADSIGYIRALTDVINMIGE